MKYTINEKSKADLSTENKFRKLISHKASECWEEQTCLEMTSFKFQKISIGQNQREE